MSEYSYKIEDVRKLTRGQIVLLTNKIKRRKEDHYILLAKMHGAYKPKGLNIDGATPIEEIIDRGKTLLQ